LNVDFVRVCMVVIGAAVFGGFLAAAVHIHAQSPQNVSIVPVSVLSALGLGVMLAAFTPPPRS
jgi:hypothetical protein